MNWNAFFAISRLCFGLGLVIYAIVHDESSMTTGLDFSTVCLMLSGYSMVHPSLDRFIDSIL